VPHPKIAVIIPTYSCLPYSRRALTSLYKYSPNVHAIVVDDASPDWNNKWYTGVGGSPLIHRFPKPGGLTRSWNQGLTMACELDADYIVTGNNDILFHHGWWQGMVGVLNKGIGLTGPLSNAPGITSRGMQDITAYVGNYSLTDNPKYNNNLSKMLWDTYGDRFAGTPVNGFFMMAKKETWLKGKADKVHFFRPVNTYNSRGKKNPTPLMTCNEDELQGRWNKKGIKSGVALGSFIFHYRSVARGQKKYGKGQFMTMTDPEKPV
jgi:glycosyltransferase involved in cell wall biosynthesis